MFKKSFKIKSNTQVKGSERKTFKELLLKTFSNLEEAQINDFLQKKDVLNVVKIVTHDEDTVHVYTVQKRPMIFDVRNKIFPTVYFLWKFPNLVHEYTTHPPVMSNIATGADLMLPGVVTSQSNLPKYGYVSQDDIVCVNLTSNKAPIAVGKAFQSASEMLSANGRGKCVTILHFYGDKLCSMDGLSNLPVPNLGPPEWLRLSSYDDDFPALGSKPPQPTGELDEKSTTNEVKPEEVLKNEQKQDDVANDNQTIDDNMDSLLEYCFWGAIKYSKTLTLPLLTSNFYKLQLLPICPPEKTLDIKKTSYKKLKPFLEKMCSIGVITVTEIKKGVEAITDIKRDHPQFTAFYMPPENRPKKPDETDVTAQTTNVMESYVITQAVLPIYQPQGLQKNDPVQAGDIRKHVTKYVKDNNLQVVENTKLVKPDAVLSAICKTENAISWEELIEKVIESMKNCYKVTSGSEAVVNKGKVSPITLNVAVRSGNKKVTLIDNLELFGVNIQQFAKECQHGVAASTSISRPPGKKCDQLLVQGNQIIFVYNLLVDRYKIPKKFIIGLENAPKKKKKK